MNSVYKLNDLDMLVEDRTNVYVRIITFNRHEGLKPISWNIPYGKNFINEFTEMILYRVSEKYKNDFIEYCKKHNIFQEIISRIEEIEASNKLEYENN